MFNLKQHMDFNTGKEYISLGVEGRNVSHFYYTEFSCSRDSGKLVATVMKDNGTGPRDDFRKNIGWDCDFYLYDLAEGGSTHIDASKYYHGTVSPNGCLYYTVGEKIYKHDLESGEKRFIAANPEGREFYGVPSVTRDGSLMTVYWKDDDGKCRSIGAVATETGKFETIVPREHIIRNFSPPNDFIDHPLINPVYKDICFYCRNGRAEEVADRLWTVSLSSKEHLNLYGQKRTADGRNGEGVGHESWSFDGERMYFVKYFKPVSSVGETGIMYADKAGRESGLIVSDFPYMHAASSPDGRYLVADTRFEFRGGRLTSDVVLVDLRTKASKLLATVGTWWNQPGHVHPCFTLDSKKIIFAFADEDFHLRLAVMEV